MRYESKRGLIPYYDLAYNRVLESNSPEVDGGEMISMIKALRHRADECFRVGRYKDQDFLIALSNRIDEEKQKYQYENGPKIAKAASSPQLTAI